MRREALLVGTTQYADHFFSTLTAPGPDVQQLHEVLTAPQIGQFTAHAPLIDEPAHKVRRALEKFFAGRSAEDLLLFYFSGHGIVDEDGQLFLGASDTERDQLRSTSVEASFVRALMDSCRSQTQLLVLDCCHSGAFGRTKAAIGSSVGTERVFGGNGRIVLTASDATQFSFEGNRVLGDTSTSLFTHFLVQGLRTGEADLDGDGLISVDELYSYAHEHVSRRTNAQTPGKWVYRQQGNVVIAQNAHPRARPDLLSPDLLSGLESRERSIQRGALEGLAEHLQGAHPGRALAARELLRSLLFHDSRFISETASQLLGRAGERPAAPPPHRTASELRPQPKELSNERDQRSAAPDSAGSQPEPVVHSAPSSPSGASVGQSRWLLKLAAGAALALTSVAFAVFLQWSAKQARIATAQKSFATAQSGCDRGDPESCINLGFKYKWGSVEHDGVAQNLELSGDFLRKAIAILRKACDGGDAHACYRQGWMYVEAHGVAADARLEQALFEKACDGGEPLGCYYLGLMYEQGREIAPSPVRAREFFTKACNGGENSGCAKLSK